MELVDLLVQYLLDNAHHAHWIIFISLILAGFNIPISEDLMLILAGTLASTVVPENTIKLFIFTFLGCYLSDWIAYWIGRILGDRLWKTKWFKTTVPQKRYNQIANFYKKNGFATLVIGRFIPFGIRNCLFITAGIIRINFLKFIISDGIACIISNSVLFYLAYTFGNNADLLWKYMKTYNLLIFGIFLLAIAAFFAFKKRTSTLQGTGKKV